MAKKKFYAIVVGKKPGIYTNWPEAQKQVSGHKGAIFKGFATEHEATDWLNGGWKKASKTAGSPKPKKVYEKRPVPTDGLPIYTDGGCINNPGPGGWGAVILQEDEEIELSGGYRKTTNNRMELLACIKALEEVKGIQGRIILHSDSSYVVNGIEKGWARKWRKNNWLKSDKKSALNSDLWKRLLELAEMLNVSFIWVKGHAGNIYNERCDTLANGMARASVDEIDHGYESQG